MKNRDKIDNILLNIMSVIFKEILIIVRFKFKNVRYIETVDIFRHILKLTSFHKKNIKNIY